MSLTSATGTNYYKVSPCQRSQLHRPFAFDFALQWDAVFTSQKVAMKILKRFFLALLLGKATFLPVTSTCEWDSELSQGGSIQPDSILEVVSKDGIFLIQGKAASFGPCPSPKGLGEMKEIIRPGEAGDGVLPGPTNVVNEAWKPTILSKTHGAGMI